MGKNTWVAYIENEKNDKTLSTERIKKALELQLTGYYDGGILKIEQLGNAIFGQIISDGLNSGKYDPVVCVNDEQQKYVYITSYREYFSESYNKYYSNLGENLGEKQIFGYLSQVDGPHIIYNNAFQKYREEGLAQLLKHGSFNYVYYNESTNEYFACVGKKRNGNKGYNPQIYYTFLDDDKNNIVMSNERSLIINLGETIYQIPDNSYIENGVVKHLKFDAEIIQEEEVEKTDDLSKLVKDMISNMASQQIQRFETSFADSLEKIAEKYILNFDINRVLTKKQRDNLILDVKQAVLTSVREDLEASKVVHMAVEEFEQQLKENIKQKVDEYMSTIYLPKVFIIKKDNKTSKEVEGVFHEAYQDVLSTVLLNEPTMLVGPAGSGKNVIVGQVSKALDLPMYYTNNASNEFKLLGYMDATGVYHETPYYTAFTKGGIFMLDEIDASDPTALIVLNSGLANGYMFFPNSQEPVQVHPDFRIITAANTWGNGADLQYIGRNPIDASTMDRFDTVFVDYDEKMESILYPDDEVLEFMWNFRKAVFDTRTPHVVSTRGIQKVYSKKINDIPIEKAVSQNIIKGLSIDYLSILVGKLDEMNTVKEDNRYLEHVKKLVLKHTPPKEDDETSEIEKLYDFNDKDMPF